MSIEGKQITDYGNFNKHPWLIEYVKNRDIKDVLSISDPQFNDLEQALYEILDGIWLENAVGEQLDVIGIILNFPRLGRDDESYRTVLLGIVEINTSSGEPERLISAIKLLFNATDVEYIPMYPAKIRIWQNGDFIDNISYDLVDDVGDTIIDDVGNTIIVDLVDNSSLSILLGVVPSGVGFYLADNLIVDDGSFLLTDTSEEIVVTFEVT
ncbi:MAG: hypothetical protein ACFFC1_03680 [Promethearchaeota archaeon]